jgi:hypothetical protein
MRSAAWAESIASRQHGLERLRVPFAYLRTLRQARGVEINSVRSRIAVLKQHLGELPPSALEEPDDINQFKTESDYADDVNSRRCIARSKR